MITKIQRFMSLVLTCVLVMVIFDPVGGTLVNAQAIPDSNLGKDSSVAGEDVTEPTIPIDTATEVEAVTEPTVETETPTESEEVTESTVDTVETTETEAESSVVSDPEAVPELQEEEIVVAKALLARSPGASNLSISINGTTYTTFQEAIENAQDGDTLVVAGGPIELTSNLSIPANKNLTIDLGSQTLVAALADSSYSLFYISGEGSFTLKNGMLIGKDVDNDGYTGRAIYADGVNLTIDSIEASGFSDYSDKGGGVLRAEDGGHVVQIILNNNNFHDNKAHNRGGAVSISTSQQNTKTLVTNNSMSGNLVTAGTYAFGGGFHFVGKGVLEIKNNTIANNEARVSDETYGFHWSHGGGMTIDSDFNAKGNLRLVLEGNTISNNKAQLFGGGIYFFMAANNGDVIDLRSGSFIGNESGYSGGAIDCSVHGQPTLELKNFLMTGNQAVAGGGIWACPSSRIESHTTLGGAVLANQLNAPNAVDSRYKTTGHDIQFEGSDTTIKSILDQNNPAIHTVTVWERTFTGEKINWYADDVDNLFHEGDKPVDLSLYTERSTTFGLLGKVEAEDWYNRYKSQVPLLFENNKAGVRGGAISTNSNIIIGEAGDKKVKVQKKWLDNEGNELTTDLPDKVEVQLIRQDEQGGELVLEKVFLTAANGWQYVFEHLPAKGLVNGSLQNFTYTVKEVGSLKGFAVSYDNESNPTDVDYSIIMTNQKQKVGDLKITKTVDGADTSAYTNEPFQFKLILQDQQVNGTYGDLVFSNGESSFTLRHGESKVAKNLPADVAYAVEEIGGTGRFTSTVDHPKGNIQAGTEIVVHFVNTPETTTTTTPSTTPTTTATFPTTPTTFGTIPTQPTWTVPTAATSPTPIYPTVTPSQPLLVPKTGEVRSDVTQKEVLGLGLLAVVVLLKIRKSLES